MLARHLLQTATVVALCIACSPAKPRPKLPAPDGALNVVEQKAEGVGDPEITFHNVSDKAMSIDFDGPTKAHLDVPAAESRTIKLPPGTYQATLSGADLVSSTSAVTCARDHRYSMSIRVVLELDLPEHAGKGFECFEIQTGPHFFECARTTARCGSMRKTMLEMNPGAVMTECSHHGPLFHFRATDTSGVQTKFFVTEAECTAFKQKYGVAFPSQTLTPCAKLE